MWGFQFLKAMSLKVEMDRDALENEMADYPGLDNQLPRGSIKEMEAQGPLGDYMKRTGREWLAVLVEVETSFHRPEKFSASWRSHDRGTHPPP